MQNKRYLLIDGSINGMAKITTEPTSLQILITMNSTLFVDTHIYLVDETNTRNALYLGKLFCEKQQDFEKNILLDTIKNKNIFPYSCGFCFVQNNSVVAQGFANGMILENFSFLDVPSPVLQRQTPAASVVLAPPFLDVFASAYGLQFTLGTLKNLPTANHCLSMLLQDKTIGDAVNLHGYCYYAYQEKDVLILGVPCFTNREPMPFLHFFQFSSFLKSNRKENFGCFFIGVHLQKSVIFPVVFE